MKTNKKGNSVSIQQMIENGLLIESSYNCGILER